MAFADEDIGSIIGYLQDLMSSDNTTNVYPFPWPETLEQHEKRCVNLHSSKGVIGFDKIVTQIADPMDYVIDACNISIASSSFARDLQSQRTARTVVNDNDTNETESLLTIHKRSRMAKKIAESLEPASPMTGRTRLFKLLTPENLPYIIYSKGWTRQPFT